VGFWRVEPKTQAKKKSTPILRRRNKGGETLVKGTRKKKRFAAVHFLDSMEAAALATLEA